MSDTRAHYGDSKQTTVRDSAVLTNSYVAGTVIESDYGFNQLILYVSFTKGSLTSGELKIEFSPDGTTYYREMALEFDKTIPVSTIYPNEYTWTTAVNYRIPVPVEDKHVRISAKGTGAVTNSLMGVIAVLSNS